MMNLVLNGVMFVALLSSSVHGLYVAVTGRIDGHVLDSFEKQILLMASCMACGVALLIIDREVK